MKQEKAKAFRLSVFQGRSNQTISKAELQKISSAGGYYGQAISFFRFGIHSTDFHIRVAVDVLQPAIFAA